MKRAHDDDDYCSVDNEPQNLSQGNEKKVRYTLNHFLKNFENDYFSNKKSELIIDQNDEFKVIQNIFQDCDPEYLIKKLNNAKSDDYSRVESVVCDLLEEKTYPKLKEFINKEKIKALQQIEFNIEDYLKLVPDPVKHFYEIGKLTSQKYRNLCRLELENEFDFVSKWSINMVLSRYNYHLAPSFNELKNAVINKQADLKLRAQRNLQAHLNKKSLSIETVTEEVLRKIPKVKFSKNKESYMLKHLSRKKIDHNDFDSEFVKELLFIKNEDKIKIYLKEQALNYSKAFQTAKENNNLHECQCCFEDNLLRENMQSCLNNHLFCKVCIKHYAETNIGDCNYEFKCMQENCDSFYQMDTLRDVLDPNVFDKLDGNIQNMQIIKANLSNLESCPFCTFCIIIENENEKVFKCLNPDCMKESCRFCKEPSHLPLRCNEIEQKNEVKMRTWIENKITESMIRVCKMCNKRFYKMDGCNLMRCVCGAIMCYVCREQIPANVGYNHFNLNGCSNDSNNTAAIHFKDSEIAYREAKEIYLKEHSEMVDIILKHDPKENLKISF